VGDYYCQRQDNGLLEVRAVTPFYRQLWELQNLLKIISGLTVEGIIPHIIILMILSSFSDLTLFVGSFDTYKPVPDINDL